MSGNNLYVGDNGNTRTLVSLNGHSHTVNTLDSWAEAGGGNDRYVWMSHSDNSGKVAYSSKLTMNISTNTLKVNGNSVIHSGNISSQTVANATNCLPLSGGTVTGTITGNTGNGLIFQSANTGSWKEGIRVYPASNNYCLISLQSSDSKNVFAMVTNVSSQIAYFDYCKNGSNRTIYMPYANGTIALTSQIPSTISWSNVTSKVTSKGSATQPVYINSNGDPVACTAYGSASVNYASSAGSVSWSNVTGKDYPTFTSLIVQNDSCNNSNDALAYFRHYSTNDWTVKIDDGGKNYGLYVCNSGSQAVKIDGNLTCTNAYTSSDRRLKKNIKDISELSLERLYDISDKLFKSFTWKQTGKESYGFIAQEMERWIPEAIQEDREGIKSVSYEIALCKILAAVIHEMKKRK
jgi:hypothetical protein